MCVSVQTPYSQSGSTGSVTLFSVLIVFSEGMQGALTIIVIQTLDKMY